MLALAAPGRTQSLPAPTDVTCTELTTDGNIQLSWQFDAPQSSDGVVFTIEEQRGDQTIRIAAGSFTSAALSGRDDGDYRYRVRAERPDHTTGAWSEPVAAKVQHHPLWLASITFLIGLVVFVATATLILTGQRRERTADSPPA